MSALTLRLPPRLSERRFIQICQANPELHLERTATGELIVMSPTGSETGLRNTHLTGQLWWWNEQQGLGEVFDFPAQPVEVCERPETLSGEEVLPGFVLRLERIWGHRQ